MFAIHGFGLSPRMWAPIVSRLPLSFITPTLPGHAGTPAASWQSTLAQLHAQAPVDALWLGYSLGGRLALAAAAEFGITAIAVSASAGIADAERARRQSWDMAQAQLLRENATEFWRGWEALPVLRLVRQVDDGKLARWRLLRREHEPSQLAEAMIALGQGRMPDYRQRLRSSRSLVSLVVGEKDEKYAAIARGADWAQVHVVADAGHSLILEAPDAVAAIVSSKVTSVQRR